LKKKMSFAKEHQKRLESVNLSVFGQAGIVDKLKQLRDIVNHLGTEMAKVGVPNKELQHKMKEEKSRAHKLCEQIESEILSLNKPSWSLFASKLPETTEEAERREEIIKLGSEFHKVRSTFEELYFRQSSLDLEDSKDREGVLLNPQLTLSQFRELHIDFEKEHKELLAEVEELLHLFEEFKDIVSDQALLLDEVEPRVTDAVLDTTTGKENLAQASKYGAFALPVVGGGVGALIGGPVGAVIGVKAGLLLSGASLGISAGLATGFGVGYWWRKKKEKEEGEWEWIGKKDS